jgi:hypothetical protein
VTQPQVDRSDRAVVHAGPVARVLKCGVVYFPFCRRTHSAMPVSSPSAISGRISSVDAPNAYATVANTHKEPMVHNAIARESGSLSMRSLSGRCWKEKLLPAPPRPVGVISLEAMSGDSIPTQTMLRWLIARSRLRSGHHHHQAELLASWLQPTRKWAVLFGVQFERRLTATGSKGSVAAARSSEAFATAIQSTES